MKAKIIAFIADNFILVIIIIIIVISYFIGLPIIDKLTPVNTLAEKIHEKITLTTNVAANTSALSANSSL